MAHNRHLDDGNASNSIRAGPSLLSHRFSREVECSGRQHLGLPSLQPQMIRKVANVAKPSSLLHVSASLVT